MANVTELHTCFKDSRADMKGRINIGTLRIRQITQLLILVVCLTATIISSFSSSLSVDRFVIVNFLL